MKLLIVDDELTNRKLLLNMLEDIGSCDLAADGKEAMVFFEKSIKEKSWYDIVFLDIKMPVMDGHETLLKMRETEEANGIFVGDGTKIVMVTALGDKKNILAAFQEGCEYYLVKPFQQNKLYDLISELGFEINQD